MNDSFGHAGKILRVDLSSGKIESTPSRDYAAFLGGRGMAQKIYWDETNADVKAFDPDNPLIFMTGPLSGFAGLASPMWEMSARSAATIPEHYCPCSLGGSWGVHLKRAGYDGIVVRGKAEKPVYLLIEDGKASLRDASRLWGKTTFATIALLKQELGSTLRVVATGPAGEHLVHFASVLADEDACGSSGMGAVMGGKNLKAVAVRGHGKLAAAHPERLRELIKHIHRLKEGAYFADFGLIAGANMEKQTCLGCTGDGCFRATYRAADGRKSKFMCGSAVFYQAKALKYYGELNDVPFFANRLCDEYGLDAMALWTIITWLGRCQQAGVLGDINTGLPLEKMGSLEFIQSLVRQISYREGFGDILARGTLGAAASLGSGAAGLVTDYIVDRYGQAFEGDPRMYLATGLIFAMAPRRRAHQLSEIIAPVWKWQDWVYKKEGSYVSNKVVRAIAARFLGSEQALDFSTGEGKALAAAMVQDRSAARESLLLCGFYWPVLEVPNSADHVGDPTLESQVYSAVTGQEVNEAGLLKLGERIFTLHRLIMLRDGHAGRRDDTLPEAFFTLPLKRDDRGSADCLVPGKDGEVLSQKGAVLSRAGFEQMKDDYYRLRGWDAFSGIPTDEKLLELGLSDVARKLPGTEPEKNQ